MAAIITTPFRVTNAESFKGEIEDNNNNVYMAIGKADAWSANAADTTDTVEDVPGDHIDDLNQAHQQLIGLKKIGASNVSHVVRRINWQNGKTFAPYDSNDTDLYDKDFYCLTSEFKVYKCIVAGTSGSTIQPSHVTAAPYKYTDNYVWKYMYTIIAADSESFLTNTYMPVKTLTSAPVVGAADRPQWDSQTDSAALATAKGVQRIVVTDGGQGYDDSDDFVFNISGNGTGLTLVDGDVTIANGEVTSINVDQTVASTDSGSGYDVCDIIISTTSGSGANATCRAVIEPGEGHGTDPVAELGGFFVALNVQLSGTEATVDNDFRQVSIIKNPLLTTNAAATAEIINPMKYLKTAASPAAISPDDLITGDPSGAKAFVAMVDAVEHKVWYYQNEKTGYDNFQDGEDITVGGTTIALESTANGGAVRYNGSDVGGPYKIGSGQVLFLENRQPINRSATQIEDIKCIIEF
jgi:hypothetical protein